MNIIKQSLHCTFKSMRINVARYNPLHISRRNRGAYEGYGKTTVEMLDSQGTNLKLISTYSQMGFRLQDTSFIAGPMIIYRDRVFCWNIGKDEDINEESLQFFFHLFPPLDLLIIGYQNHENRKSLDQSIPITCRKNNLQVEILPTVKAVHTYNFLAPIRHIAGALIPPNQYAFDNTDITIHGERYDIDQGRDTESPEILPFRYPKSKK